MDLAMVPDFTVPMQQDERRKVRPNNTVVFQNQMYGPLPEDMVGEVVRLRVVDSTLQVRTDTRILATFPLEAAQPVEADAVADEDMAPLLEDTAQVAEL
jgi:hypothetical protein